MNREKGKAGTAVRFSLFAVHTVERPRRPRPAAPGFLGRSAVEPFDVVQNLLEDGVPADAADERHAVEDGDLVLSWLSPREETMRSAVSSRSLAMVRPMVSTVQLATPWASKNSVMDFLIHGGRGVAQGAE